MADYPSHRELLSYFHDFASAYHLRDGFRFGTEVTRIEPAGEKWAVTATGPDGTSRTTTHAGVLIANGTLSEPAVPTFEGTFDGEMLHTSAYKRAEIFAGKRVLVIGAGNSGCDIAVDAVHHAASVDLSVRRGYYFVPKYLFGRPADTLNQGRPLPARIKQAVDSRLLKAFTGDPVRFGFPKPDDIERLDGDGVRFVDGERAAYDLVVLATGYHLHYPFVDPALLNWDGPGHGTAPNLYLNIFARSDGPARNLFMLGMIEASGIGWQGRYEQAELVAAYLTARHEAPEQAAAFEARTRGPRPDLSGGYHYLELERMSYYVNKDAYRSTVRAEVKKLRTP